MLRSARANDACSAGFVYLGVAPVRSSGWNIDMKSMKTPKSVVWIVASGLQNLSPRFRRARSHIHQTSTGLSCSSCERSGSGSSGDTHA